LFFEIEGLTFRHPNTEQGSKPALRDVSFSVREGEWITLIGANGSGKTTLARHLNGLFIPSHGKVLVNGLDTHKEKNLPLIRSLVGMVFQSPEDQIISSLVLEDTAFGPENLGIATAEINQRVEKALNTVRMWDHRDKAPHLLSAGQIQRVALAGVLAMQPRCVIFDETTAMLDPVGRQAVLKHMESLHKKGITIVMITHSMDEAIMAQRVVVLHEGQLAVDGKPEAIFMDEALLQKCHLQPPACLRAGRLIEKFFSVPFNRSRHLDEVLNTIPQNDAGTQSTRSAIKKKVHGSNTVVVAVNDLQHTYQAGTPFESHSLRGISLSVLSGKIHGLVGATGSGKSTLLQHLNGLYLPQSGNLRVGEYDLNDPNLDVRALRRYVGIVFQNPESFFFEHYVGDEIAFGPKLLYGRDGLRERVKKAMEQAGLDFDDFKDRSTMTLSGGEKRKVALASALAMTPGLLVLDEPTAGLDPHARRDVLQTLRSLHSDGLEIILSSHNMDDITELAQDMTLLEHGSSLGTGSVSDIFAQSELIEQANLVAPPGVRFAAALHSKGWILPEECITFSCIEDRLERGIT
jgi:energy-coupling factor transport system ATP-binding protein